MQTPGHLQMEIEASLNRGTLALERVSPQGDDGSGSHSSATKQHFQPAGCCSRWPKPRGARTLPNGRALGHRHPISRP
jgi:hypothetical protein